MLKLLRNLFKKSKVESVDEPTCQAIILPNTNSPFSVSNSNEKSEFIFIDTETTGLNRDGLDEIVEIAIVDKNGTQLLNTLVRPIFNKDWQDAERVHGISPEDVKSSPELSDILETIKKICKGKTAVFYNASFDTGFFPPNFFPSVVCAMRQFSEVNPNGNKWIPLEQAAAETGYVPVGKIHRALEDAMACRHIWICGISIAQKIKDSQLLPTINAKYRSEEGEIFNVIFKEIYPKEIAHVEQGSYCTLWSRENLDVIYLYRSGTIGGQGKVAILSKSDNISLKNLLSADNELLLHVKERGMIFLIVKLQLDANRT